MQWGHVPRYLKHPDTHTTSLFGAYARSFIDLPVNGNNSMAEVDKTNVIKIFFSWSGSRNDYPREYYASTNITAVHEDTRLIHWKGNRGSIHILLTNPYHAKWFEKHRLHRGNAFGCASQYLFQPTQAIFTPDTAALWTLFQIPDTQLFKIGMHIRMGDSVLCGDPERNNTNLAASVVAPFVACAQQIEIFHRRQQGHDFVSWYITSDSQEVVTYFQMHHGNRTVALPAMILEHAEESSMAGMRSTIQEHALLGMQDYTIQYDLTSYGRSGSLRQLKRGGKHMYDIHRGSGPTVDPRISHHVPKCGLNDFARWEHYSDAWVGI